MLWEKFVMLKYSLIFVFFNTIGLVVYRIYMGNWLKSYSDLC